MLPRPNSSEFISYFSTCQASTTAQKEEEEKKEKKAPPVVAFHELSTWEKVGVRCLRVAHFLLARSGLFLAIFMFCLLSERAEREKQPPVHPWIIYIHVSTLVLLLYALYALQAFQTQCFVVVTCSVRMACQGSNPGLLMQPACDQNGLNIAM